MFVTISKDRMKANSNVNVKEYVTKEYVIKELFGILVIVSVNVINHATQENIWTIKIPNVETN